MFDVSVKGDNVHAEGAGFLPQQLADAPVTDDAQGLPHKFGACQRFLGPLTGFHSRVGAREGAG